MVELKPQEVRDKILGALYPHFPASLTFKKIKRLTGLSVRDIKRELLHILEDEMVRLESDLEEEPEVRESFREIITHALAEPGSGYPDDPFIITPKGRKHMEGPAKAARTKGEEPRVGLPEAHLGGPRPTRRGSPRSTSTPSGSLRRPWA